MNKETLDFLIEKHIFTLENTGENFYETIANKEIGMSRAIIENNWNIGSLLPFYKGIDFRFIYKKPIDYPILFQGDVMYPPYYEKKYWKPEDLIFIKGNRCPNIPAPTPLTSCP
jgi:hypothetical protein